MSKKVKLWVITLFSFLLSLGITFYAWQIVSNKVFETSQTKFEVLTKESENALLHRIQSYEQFLLGGKGFFLGSKSVERHEWKSYIHSLNLHKHLPGIGGIGWIANIRTDLNAFVEKTRADNYPSFDIHPKEQFPGNFIITYVEPEASNKAAIGLNIAFEERRFQAAKHAQESGKSTITRNISFVQDTEDVPGFLLLLPVY